MFLLWRVLLCFLALASLIDVRQVNAKKSSHSYPKSGKFSGGGHHGHPFSGSSHGSPSYGGSHKRQPPDGSHGHTGSIPKSSDILSRGGSGQQSGGSHGYPSTEKSHGYSKSGGMSGDSHGYSPKTPARGSHGYSSTEKGHEYPKSGGMSGNNHRHLPKTPAGGTHNTNVHYHYHYNPPQQITYTPLGGGAPKSYPVYHGPPPTYVYQIKDSGSKYGTLLAGLALLNLGTLAGKAHAPSHSSPKYTPKRDEVCLFGVKKDNGDYEETKINCRLMSSYIIQEEAKVPNVTNTSITTTVTNVTVVNTTNVVPEMVSTTTAPGKLIYKTLENGTLVSHNATSANSTANVTTAQSNVNNTMTSSVTITTTNTTVTNALDVKGKPVKVTPGMQCFVIRTTPTSRMKKAIPCGLLQTYADKSIKRNLAVRNGPAFTILAIVFALGFVY